MRMRWVPVAQVRAWARRPRLAQPLPGLGPQGLGRVSGPASGLVWRWGLAPHLGQHLEQHLERRPRAAPLLGLQVVRQRGAAPLLGSGLGREQGLAQEQEQEQEQEPLPGAALEGKELAQVELDKPALAPAHAQVVEPAAVEPAAVEPAVVEPAVVEPVVVEEVAVEEVAVEGVAVEGVEPAVQGAALELRAVPLSQGEVAGGLA